MRKNKVGRPRLTYKSFLEILEWDTPITELKEYLNGTKEFNYTIVTPERKQELLTTIIPQLIIKLEQDRDEDVKDWSNAPLFRLSYIYCLNNRKPFYNIFNVAMEIINRIHKGNREIILQKRFQEYYNRAKEIELDDTAGLKKLLKRL